MSLPPALGTLSYNGVTFDASSNFTVSQKPVMTPDGRTVSHSLYTIEVTGKVTSGPTAATTTDTTMDSWRDALSASAGTLRISSKGYGTFVINPTSPGESGVYDVMWGPIPTLLRFKPLGGAKAADVTWSVEVRIPCSDGPTTRGTLMEATYSVNFSQDTHGRTRRTIDGQAKIAVTRLTVTSTAVPATIDTHRERLVPRTPPTGFRRMSLDWNVSQDKASATWNIVDEQIPSRNYPAPGIVLAEASHRVASQDRGFVKWIATVTGKYEVSDTRELRLAWESFAKLVGDRYFTGLAQAGVVQLDGKSQQGFVYPLSFEFSEPEIYGSGNAAFSMTYMLITSAGNVLRASGLWRPVPDSNYALWAASMGDLWGPRGSAGLRVRTTDDLIVSLCLNSRASTLRPTGTIPYRGPTPPVGAILRAKLPPPEDSWLEHDMRLLVEEEGGAVLHPRLPSTPTKPKPSQSQLVASPERPTTVSALTAGLGPLGTPQAAGIAVGATTAGVSGGIDFLLDLFKTKATGGTSGGSGSFLGLTGGPGFNYQPTTSQPARVQYRAKPRFFVTLEGFAARIGYNIPLPQIVSIAGCKAIPMNVQGKHGVRVGTARERLGGLPVNTLHFSLRYGLDNVPGEIPTPYRPV